MHLYSPSIWLLPMDILVSFVADTHVLQLTVSVAGKSLEALAEAVREENYRLHAYEAQRRSGFYCYAHRSGC
jgi:hypothetical protein